MITSNSVEKKFGQPGGSAEGSYMVVWNVPADIQAQLGHVKFSALGTVGFPKKIYLNKLLQQPLENALRNLIQRGHASQLKTWDGCFLIRNARGLSSWSLHSWGLAVDLNAATNRLGTPPTLSSGFVNCFLDAGFDWGGGWRRPDGMHFQLGNDLFSA